MAYEIELTLQDQRKELMEMADTVNRALQNIHRKRSILPSERAMTVAKYKRALIAINMAVDRIDAIV